MYYFKPHFEPNRLEPQNKRKLTFDAIESFPLFENKVSGTTQYSLGYQY